MSALLAAAWCARAALLQPWTLVLWTSVLLSSWVSTALRTEIPSSASVPAGRWILATTTVGGLLALRRLSTAGALLGAAPPGARIGIELGAIGCTILVVSWPALIALGDSQGAAALVAAAVLALHQGAVAVLLLRVPWTPRSRLGLHAFLVWMLPALWSGTSGWRGTAARLLGPPGLWSSERSEPLTLVPPLVDMAPIAALLGAAWLVLSSNPRRQCATAS